MFIFTLVKLYWTFYSSVFRESSQRLGCSLVIDVRETKQTREILQCIGEAILMFQVIIYYHFFHPLFQWKIWNTFYLHYFCVNYIISIITLLVSGEDTWFSTYGTCFNEKGFINVVIEGIQNQRQLELRSTFLFHNLNTFVGTHGFLYLIECSSLQEVW